MIITTGRCAVRWIRILLAAAVLAAAGAPRAQPVMKLASATINDVQHEWLRKFDRPEEAYSARLIEIAQTPPHSNISKLGLVRIVYEAGCKLDAAVDGGVLRITASLQL